MFKILSKIFFLFICIVSLLAVLISFWAYFIDKKFTLSVFMLTTLFFGFAFIFGLYNFFKDNDYLKAILLTRKINVQFLLWNFGNLIFGGCFLYLGIVRVEDFSAFNRTLFIFAGVFLLTILIISLSFKQKGIKQYSALPKEKRDDVERRISFLSKIEPVFVFIVTILAFIFYLITRK